MIIIKVNNNRLTINDNHISETEFLKIPFDYEIDNNTTLDVLYSNIDNNY